MKFEPLPFDHIFRPELSLYGDIPSDIRKEWDEVVARYRKGCWDRINNYPEQPTLQARSCLELMETFPHEFDRFMCRIFDRDPELGLEMYYVNWNSMQHAYIGLTLYLAFCSKNS